MTFEVQGLCDKCDDREPIHEIDETIEPDGTVTYTYQCPKGHKEKVSIRPKNKSRRVLIRGVWKREPTDEMIHKHRSHPYWHSVLIKHRKGESVKCQ